LGIPISLETPQALDSVVRYESKKILNLIKYCRIEKNNGCVGVRCGVSYRIVVKVGLVVGVIA
jgi:hypothetical protein